MDGGPVLCIREAKLGNSFQLIFCLAHKFEWALKLAEQREGMFPISHVGMEWLQIFFLWQMKRWWQRLSFCLEDIKISVILAHLIFRYFKVTLCPQFHQVLHLQHLSLLYCASNLGCIFQQVARELKSEGSSGYIPFTNTLSHWLCISPIACSPFWARLLMKAVPSL